MRTGVLVVDGRHRIRLSNEAAYGLLGSGTHHRRDLQQSLGGAARKPVGLAQGPR
jgi:two-component system sensor histidine kinase PilS (NtrC family)